MAWTLNIEPYNDVMVLGRRHLTLKLECISDGSQLAPVLLSSFAGWDLLSKDQKMAISFGRIASLTTVPGTGAAQPLATYDVHFYSGLGAPILTSTGRSISSVEIAFPVITSEVAPNMQGIPYIKITDLGDAGDKTTLYIEVCMSPPDVEELIKKSGGSANLPV